MQRYFAPVVSKHALLSEEDRHHLLDVMRSEVGTPLEIVHEGNVFSAKVTSIAPLEITVGELVSRESELPAHLFLAFALLKHGNDDLVLEKGTELGVSRFYPFISQRTIIRLASEEDREKKQNRANKIVKAAAEQSKRTTIPEVQPILSYREILSLPADLKLLAYENKSDDVASLPMALSSLKPGQNCLMVIGPEGGFSEEEAQEAEQQGFHFVSLGRRILRAETASLYAASVFGYHVEGQ